MSTTTAFNCTDMLSAQPLSRNLKGFRFEQMHQNDRFEKFKVARTPYLG